MTHMAVTGNPAGDDQIVVSTATTPVAGGTTDVAQAQPGADAGGYEGLSQDDEDILADLNLSGATGAERGTATPADSEQPADKDAESKGTNEPEKKPDVDARQADLDAREAELNRREAALAGGAGNDGTDADKNALADNPGQDPNADQVPQFSQIWEEEKKQIVAGWNEYQAPGEERLVAFIDRLAPAVDAIQASQARFEQEQQRRETEAAGVRIAQAAIDASATLASEVGEEITPETLLGEIQNGGLVAWAALKGVPTKGLVITPEIVKEVYALKNPGKVKAAQAAAAPAPKQPVRDLDAGGAPRLQTTPQDEDALILADLNSVKK